MHTSDLVRHITERVRSGALWAETRGQLVTVGWSEDEVDRAYASALIEIGVPTPSAGVGVAARKASTAEIVTNFFSFVLLAIILTALGMLYFALIDRYFPDPLMDRYYSYRSTMDALANAVFYAIAALMVAFPLYVVAVRWWFRRFREDEGKVESKLTKWVTYLVLVVAAGTIVGDLISILYTLLKGEYGARFFLKALTVLTLAGMVFGFYLLERQRVQYKHAIDRRVFHYFGWALGVLVVSGVALGFSAVGSPSTERARTFDARRAEGLSSVVNCVNGFASQFRRLPVSLEDFNASSQLGYCAGDVQDPETGKPYEYRVVIDLHPVPSGILEGEVELCAVFSTDTMNVREGGMYGNADTWAFDGTSEKWHRHIAGRECDTETISVESVNTMKPIIDGNF